MNREIKSIAGCALSVGNTVYSSDKKTIYTGKILKPWTWLRFERVKIVKSFNVNHVALAFSEAGKKGDIVNASFTNQVKG